MEGCKVLNLYIDDRIIPDFHLCLLLCMRVQSVGGYGAHSQHTRGTALFLLAF